MTKNMSDSPENIMKRLEKLRQWQEEQQQILIERQNSQREMLNLEQQQMYDLLGISQLVSSKPSASKNRQSNEGRNSNKLGNHIPHEEGIKTLLKPTKVAAAAAAAISNADGDSGHQGMEFDNSAATANKNGPPKKPYLKRGEGLTTRFKINPNALRLHNLPKYKYANSYKKFSQNKNDKDQVKRKEGTGKNLKSKYSAIDRGGGDKLKDAETKKSTTKLQLSSSNFLKSFLTLSRNPCKRDQSLNNPENSETSKEISRESDHTQASNSGEHFSLKKSRSQSNLEGTSSEGSQSKSTTTVEPVSWAQVLDTENPIPVQYFRNNSIAKKITTLDSSEITAKSQADEDLNDSVSLFELLERRTAEDSNVSLDISNLRKWIAVSKSKLFNDNRTEIDPLSIERVKSRISPVPFDIEKKIVLDESENEDDSGEDDSGDDNDNDDSNEEDRNSTPDNERKVPKNHVRFDDNVQINELESDTDTVLSNEIESMNISKTSTPTDKLLFEKFKTCLFGGEITIDDDDHNGNEINDLTLIENKKIIDDNKKEILEKTELLKSRLLELEKEISTFKEHNAELIKLKQQHELDKIQVEQERVEMQEKLNDERIKIEIYLHDERMKIEEEKKKLEKLINAQKVPNRREREEITKLKEQVENLQKENRNKENRHVAAQSRLRAQLRVLEKEVKDLNFETEHLKKEIKKLESENSKLNRMNNNKMLQEINKTISKLAPKMEAIEVSNKNPKAVVAKVVSHMPARQVNLPKNSKSKSVPNLCRTAENDSTPSITTTEEDSEFDDDDDDDDNDGDDDNDASSETIKSSEMEQSQYFPKTSTNRKIIKKHKKTKNKSHKNIDSKIEDKNQQRNAAVNSSNKDLRREIINTDGSKDIWYPNGNLKKISSDGMIIRMLYYNKDIKETNITEGTVKYYYSETNTWHTTYLDGLEILEFPNGQTEHRYKDGTIEVHFPNGSIRISNSTDEKKSEEWRYPDGTTLIHLKNGDKVLSLPNGQKEIHTKLQKRREYPDGTVKIVYPDGSQETRYSNGRVRLKDKFGNLVMDSEDSNY